MVENSFDMGEENPIGIHFQTTMVYVSIFKNEEAIPHDWKNALSTVPGVA